MKKILILVFLIIAAKSVSGITLDKKVHSVLKSIYKPHSKSFYCGCQFNIDSFKVNNEFINCNYLPKNTNDRAIKRITWKNIIPTSRLLKHYSNLSVCKKYTDEKGKVKCLRQYSQSFREVYNDIFNKVPVIEEVDNYTNNYFFNNIPYENYIFGRCVFELDSKTKSIEPTDNLKGDVSRIIFHMVTKYKDIIEIYKDELDLLQDWNVIDPLDINECNIISAKNNITPSLYFSLPYFKFNCTNIERNNKLKANSK